MKNNRTKWSIEDDKILVDSYSSDHNYEKIADILERTTTAIKCRFVKIYIYPKIRNHFYNNNKLIKNNLNRKSFNNFIERYAIFYNINLDEITKYIKYCDNNLKPYDDIELDKELKESDGESSESDEDTSESDEDTSESDEDTSESDEDTSESDENSSESDEDTSESDQNNIYKLKYYKYRYLYEKLKKANN
jgi:hypothetical protein